MFTIRGKTTKGNSVTGPSNTETFAEAAQEAEEAAEAAGDSLAQLSIKPLGAGKGLKVAAPRKREGGKKGKGK